MAEVQQQQAEPAERVEEDRDRDRVQKEQEEEEEETVTTLSMIGTSATTEGGSFRTNPEELIRYEDQHVKLTDTELLLKTYYNNDNGHNSVTILLSHIVHVCWAGSDDQKKKKKPSLLTKFKKKSKKSKTTKKQKPTGKKIGNDDDDDDIANEEAEAEDKKKKKEHHKKQKTKISKRFVVVASTKGSQQTTGYGFSVLEDPLLFHKLIQPSHYVAIEKKAKAKADAKAAADDRKNATPRESVIAVASSAGQFIRNLSKDNLSSLMGGGGDDKIKGSTANKNDKEIMASGTLGSAISTGELQSLLAGYHIDDGEEAEDDGKDNEEDGDDEEEDEETTEVATVDGIVGVVSYPSLHEQNRYHGNTAECHFEEQHDDRPLPPRD